MTHKNASASHTENADHEALLSGAIALAALFSNCVEAFGLIHPSQKWDREEQLLLTRLGLQQARLLVWGAVLGVASPPPSVTDRAVPQHPSLAYPDLTEPTFFDPRDSRLDDPHVRTTIEQTLGAIVDRSSSLTREEMMGKFGLRPPKRFTTIFEPALDANRLAAWREKYALLREVAESFAQINARRTNSIVHTPWMIADVIRFRSFIDLTQEKADYLIELMGVKEKVDRAMRMDIRVLGWHVTFDRSRTAIDISKLRLLQQICTEGYPEYMQATQQALDNITRESRESNAASYGKSPRLIVTSANDGSNEEQQGKKRPGVFKMLRSFGKHKDHGPDRSKSVSGPVSAAEDPGPARSFSDAGPYTGGGAALGRVRSKSVGGHLEPLEIDDAVRQRLDEMDLTAEVGEAPHEPHAASKPEIPLVPGGPVGSITRHDQYRGIARVDSRDLSQPGGDFSTR